MSVVSVTGSTTFTGNIVLSVSIGETNPVNSTNIWVNAYGGTQADAGLQVASDSSSNVFMGGYFSGTANFGHGNVASAGGEDIVFTKCNFGGTNQWVKTFGSTGSDRCNSLAVDSSGNVFVTGYFNGTINMGGTNLVSSGGRDVFLAKYNNAGTHQWSKKYGSAGDEIAYRIAADTSGNIFVTGFFQGTGNFGTTNLPSANNGLDSFVAKYDGNGVPQWSKRFSPNNSDDIGYGIDTDSAGNVIVCGVFQGTINLGGTNHPPTGAYNMYIVKLNGTTGGWIWDFAYGSTSDDFAYTVAVDSADNVFMGGFFQGTVNFGGGAYVATQTDGVVVKLNSSGAYQWSRQLGGILGDTVNGIAIGPSDVVLVTGSFQSAVNFGGGPSLVSAGSTDGFLAKYSSANAYLWAERFGGGSGDNGNYASVDTTGYILTTGSFNGSFTFAGIPVSSAGLGDIFLWRHAP